MSDAVGAAASSGAADGAGAGAGAGAGSSAGSTVSSAAHGVQSKPTHARSTQFGQVVLGPPGAGKTTYCNGMHQFLTALGRPCVIVNLDPANDGLPFDVGVDVMDLISLEDVMEEFGLGPNGGLMYCMEFLEANFDWLLAQLAKYPNTYFLFDCPGQVELYTHHESMTRILERLNKEAFRLAAVHLVDAQHCKDGGHFISMALTSLATMMRLELPHVNVLSKIDLFQRFGMPPLSLDSYTRVSDLHLMASMIDRPPADADSAGGVDDLDALFDDAGSGSDGDDDDDAGGAVPEGGAVKPRTFAHRFRKLNRAIVEVLDDYSMVGYRALDIRDKDSVAALLRVVDKSNGYAVGYLGEPARDLESMPEFGRWDDEVAMERVARAAEVEEQVTQPVTEEPAARGQ